MSTEAAVRVATRFVWAANYRDYVERKKREGEKPLGRNEWLARIEGRPKGEEDAPEEKPKGGLLGRLKGKLSKMSDAAKKVLTEAPKAAQSFFTDSAYRKESLGKARSAIKAAPKKYVESLVKTAKHEVHEFKEAGKGIAAVMRGEKMSTEQKHAVKTVAKHMAIMAAAAALSTAGVGAGAAFMGKAMAKHIALKAAADVLGDIHTLGEVGIIGQGLVGLLSKIAAEDDKKLSPEDALGALVIAKVLDQMDKLDDDDMADILEAAAKG